MVYYISIDGGGTKTEGVAVNSDGKIVNRLKVGSSNPNDLGTAQSVNVIVGLVKELMPLDATAVKVAIGGSGIKSAGLEQPLKQAILSLGKIDKVEVLTDVLTAFYSAYDECGSILIIGTGCVGYLAKGGQETFFGGGGHFFDRLFSGFDLGREVVNAVLEQDDGRGDKTLLADLFKVQAGCGAREALKTLYEKGKADVASFAPLVFKAFEQGDEVAKNILAKCVSDLERLLWAMYRKNGEQKLEITVFGGLNAKLETIKSFMSTQISQKISLVLPTKPIIFGGLKLVANISQEFEENFLKDYN